LHVIGEMISHNISVVVDDVGLTVSRTNDYFFSVVAEDVQLHQREKLMIDLTTKEAR